MGNAFLTHNQYLLVIDTIYNDQYTKFVTEIVEQCTTTATRTLPKNNMSLIRKPPVGVKSIEKEQLAALKSDCGLYMSCQTRDGDIDHFFSHENQAGPPALSTGGKMRIGIKSYLLRSLESDLLEHNAVPFC